jgi:hypothetical protein
MMGEDGEFLRPMVRAVIQESLEAESSGHYLFFKSSREGGRVLPGERLSP